MVKVDSVIAYSQAVLYAKPGDFESFGMMRSQ